MRKFMVSYIHAKHNSITPGHGDVILKVKGTYPTERELNELRKDLSEEMNADIIVFSGYYPLEEENEEESVNG